MPTITFSLADFCKLIGKKIVVNELATLLEYAKAEIEHVDHDDITVKFNDTNQPYLWSAEGIALLLRGILGKEKGIPPLKLKISSTHIIVNKSVNSARPFIAAFTARGPALTEYVLKQIIQLQEKLCDNYGRHRQKIAIGVYPTEKIAFPITYKAVPPDSVKFVPLGWREPMTLTRILQSHSKGKEYAHILEGQKKYPILVDTQQNILSFPPIINSDEMGNLKPGDTSLFFEATGTDIVAVDLATTIFAYTLAARGFVISSVTILADNKKKVSPNLTSEKIKINKDHVEHMLGMTFKDADIKKLLEKMRYSVSGTTVTVPPYRRDIMHENDIIEDIAIAYGYNTIEALPLLTFTRGAVREIIPFINTCRHLLVGQGYQEVFSAILSNKIVMQQKMKLDEEIIEIENFTSQTYSALRTSILPQLLETLGQNKHVDYPQKLFEEGLITHKKGQTITDRHVLAIVETHTTAHFTSMRQTITSLLALLGLSDFSIKETEHASFVPGRVVNIFINNEPIGIFGEIHPAVLSNFHIELPVVAAELFVEKIHSFRQ